MCTIGVVFDKGSLYTFKQCDLIPTVNFRVPETRQGSGDVATYVALSRDDGTTNGRLWAGINCKGVGFVAADSYTTSSLYNVTVNDTTALFAAYEDSIKHHQDVVSASKHLVNFYLGNVTGTAFPAPDIALHTGMDSSGKQTAIFTEYMPGPNNHSVVRQIVRTSGYFASTNHFRIQPEAIIYPNNHSTYLRLARAEAILQRTPTKEGVKTLLCDQYYGKTELSICRETDYPEQEFRTQATALFTSTPEAAPLCEYQVNSNPKDNPPTPYVPTKEI